MESAEPPITNVREAVNRGYNLVATALLGIGGLAFGPLIFEEMDSVDKIDNSILALVAIIAVVWYFTGNHRFQRSLAPVAFAALGVAGQLVGFAIEFGDPTAIGDDIGGIFFYLPVLLVLLALRSIDQRLAP